MTRAALILLALTGSAEAATLLDRAHCWAYPHHERCRPPVPAPRPVEATPEPVQAPVVAPPPAPVYVPAPPPVAAPAPPVAAPVVVRPKPVKAKPRVKTKAVPTKPKRKRVAMPAWWNCADARARVAGKTRAELALMRTAARLTGYTLTAEQQAEAKRCLGFS